MRVSDRERGKTERPSKKRSQGKFQVLLNTNHRLSAEQLFFFLKNRKEEVTERHYRDEGMKNESRIVKSKGE